MNKILTILAQTLLMGCLGACCSAKEEMKIWEDNYRLILIGTPDPSATEISFDGDKNKISLETPDSTQVFNTGPKDKRWRYDYQKRSVVCVSQETGVETEYYWKDSITTFVLTINWLNDNLTTITDQRRISLPEGTIARSIVIDDKGQRCVARIGPKSDPRPPEGQYLLLVDWRDGLTTTTIPGGEHFDPCDISPDGRLLACEGPDYESIYVVNLETKAIEKLDLPPVEDPLWWIDPNEIRYVRRGTDLHAVEYAYDLKERKERKVGKRHTMGCYLRSPDGTFVLKTNAYGFKSLLWGDIVVYDSRNKRVAKITRKTHLPDDWFWIPKSKTKE